MDFSSSSKIAFHVVVCVYSKRLHYNQLSYVRIHFRNNGVVVDIVAVFGDGVSWSDCILREGNFGFGLCCPFDLIGFIVGVGVSTTGNVTRL